MYTEFRDKNANLPPISYEAVFKLDNCSRKKYFSSSMTVRIKETNEISRFFSKIGFDFWDYMMLFNIGQIYTQRHETEPFICYIDGFNFEHSINKDKVCLRLCSDGSKIVFDRNRLHEFVCSTVEEIFRAVSFLSGKGDATATFSNCDELFEAAMHLEEIIKN